MPVIHVSLGRELFDQLGPDNRKDLGNTWRELIRWAFEEELNAVACKWNVWDDAQNMEDMEISVENSDSIIPLERKYERFCGAMRRDIARSSRLPDGTKVGIWPKQDLYSRYVDVTVGETIID